MAIFLTMVYQARMRGAFELDKPWRGDIYTYKNGHAAEEVASDFYLAAYITKSDPYNASVSLEAIWDMSLKRSEIMRVVLTNLPGESHWHNGQAHCAGAVIDLPKEVAERMIGGGLAVKLGAEAKTSASAKTSAPLDAEVTLPPMPEVSE
jgi:hypothetical protein